jgi:rRNA maturation protein Nop10
MALVKCPQCGHTVLSVASACPKCSRLLTQEHFPPSSNGTLTECRSCGCKVFTDASVCPHCGVRTPGRRWPSRWVHTRPARAGMIGAALLGLVIVRAGLRQFASGLAAGSTTRSTVASIAGDAVLPRAIGPTGAPVVGTQVKWASTWVNVRSGAGTNRPVTEILKPGQRVEVSDLRAGWWSVWRDGRHVGYVATSVLWDRPPEPGR